MKSVTVWQPDEYSYILYPPIWLYSFMSFISRYLASKPVDKNTIMLNRLHMTLFGNTVTFKIYYQYLFVIAKLSVWRTCYMIILYKYSILMYSQCLNRSTYKIFFVVLNFLSQNRYHIHIFWYISTIVTLHEVVT